MPVAEAFPEACRIPVLPNAIEQFLEDLASFEFDPYGFVLWAYPWGEPGTSLEHEDGPEQWQRDVLTDIGDKLRAGGSLGAVVLEAVAAGHGVGKSAFVAWLIHWAISTHPDTRGVITANTDTQLRTKTWAELAKWNQLFIGKEYFQLTATCIYSNDREHQKTWRIDQVPWSKDNTESFAGLHNKGKRTLVLFDEASAIEDVIWEVTEGATTDVNTQIVWCAFGNPTRTSGRFHRVTTHPQSRFKAWRVDSRDVRFSNKAQIQAWADEYGEDSDFFRVRVKGMPPRAGVENFISFEDVQAAQQRRLPPAQYAAFPRIMSIDPARFGNDFTVITLRQGYKLIYQVRMSGFDGPEVAKRVGDLLTETSNVSCIAYDAIGIGADLDSSLRRMHGLPTLVPVAWGVPAKDTKQYFNQRAEAWGRMKEWLKFASITPDDETLSEELTAMKYGYSATLQIQLQSKKDLKVELGRSPDMADSLALSFVPELIETKTVIAKAKPVVRRQVVWSKNG